MEFEFEPVREISGSAFNGNTVQGTRPFTTIQGKERTNYVSLTDWCKRNSVSKRTGYKLIKLKLLIAQRLYGQWWVSSNPDCLERLLEYLGMEELVFDANNQLK